MHLYFYYTGDTTRLYLPGFLSSTGEDLILSNSDFGGSSKGDYDSEGAITWNQAASTLTLVRDSDSAILSPSMVKLEMFDVLQLPYDGLGADDDSLQIAVEAVSCTAVATSVEESDSVNTGIFTASSLSFSSLYSGTVTDLNLIVAYSASLAARDVLVLTLSGFTGPVGEVELELDAAYSDTADYNHTGAVIWKSADSTITFTRDWNAPKIDGGTSLTLVVPSSQLIALPTSGVQKNDTRILLSMSAAAGSTEVGRSSPILFTEAVAEGVLLSSSLTFSTSRTGTNCQVNISFTLSHDLHGGDTIEIMLEGFTGPTGSITGVMGDDAGDFDDDAVNSVTWDNNRSALTLTRDNDGLATLGGVSILVSVPLSAGITTPAVGRAADDNAYTISTQSDAGQIIAASVASSTAIDSGVLLSFALDFDPPIAGVETKITITLTCSTSIGGGERFDLSLPGFSSRMRQHNLHNEITGNNGDDFTTEDNAFYDRDTSVLTLIRDSDAVVIPAGTEIEMVIGVLAIRLPTSGLTLANSVEFSEGAVSTAIYRPYINIGRLLNLAPVRNSHCTVFTSVTKGQFLTSSLSFASDSDGDGINDGVFVGQTASISLAWAVTLDMVAGDYIDLHLPGFTHNATESDKTIGTLTGDDGNVYSGEWQDPLSSPVLRLTRAGSSSMVPGRTKQEITISANDGVRIPSDGLSVNDASLLIACTAVSGTVLPAVSISMSSQVSIAVLIASSVHFTPALSGAASEVTIDITLSQDILVGDQIQIVLPGFFGVADGANLSYVTSSSSSSPIDFSDLDTTGFDGVLPMWSAIDETITFTRDTSTYPANIPIQLSIDISNGLKLPATGMVCGYMRIARVSVKSQRYRKLVSMRVLAQTQKTRQLIVVHESFFRSQQPILFSFFPPPHMILMGLGMLKNSASITVEVVGIPSTPQTSFNTSDAVNTGVFEQAAVSFTDSDGNTPQLGSVVQLSFTIQLSSQLAEGETITLTLTNFQHYTYTDIDAASNSAGDTSIDVGGVVTMILDGSGAVGFGSRAIWDTDAHTLSFTRSIGAGRFKNKSFCVRYQRNMPRIYLRLPTAFIILLIRADLSNFFLWTYNTTQARIQVDLLSI